MALTIAYGPGAKENGADFIIEAPNEHRSWNDFGYHTIYRILASPKITGRGVYQPVGGMKMMTSGQEIGDKYSVVKEMEPGKLYESLPYCTTICWNMEFYRFMQTRLTKDQRVELTGMLHLNWSCNDYNSNLHDECFMKSLLRNRTHKDMRDILEPTVERLISQDEMLQIDDSALENLHIEQNRTPSETLEILRSGTVFWTFEDLLSNKFLDKSTPKTGHRLVFAQTGMWVCSEVLNGGGNWDFSGVAQKAESEEQLLHLMGHVAAIDGFEPCAFAMDAEGGKRDRILVIDRCKSISEKSLLDYYEESEHMRWQMAQSMLDIDGQSYDADDVKKLVAQQSKQEQQLHDLQAEAEELKAALTSAQDKLNRIKSEFE